MVCSDPQFLKTFSNQFDYYCSFIKYSLSSKTKLKVGVEKDVGGYIASKGAMGTGASGAGVVGDVEIETYNDTF